MKNIHESMTITILGTGYVGLTTAAIFAIAGYKTYIVDPNKSRLDSVRQGKSFFYEEGLDALISNAVNNGLLIPTSSYKKSVPNSSIVFSAVGTPDHPDGSSNLQYVYSAAREAAKYLKDGSIYIQKSTVPVGTGREVAKIFKASGLDISYVSNPEFLREGTALADSLWFDRIVVGGDTPESLREVHSIYKKVEKKRKYIAKIADLTQPTKYESGRCIATTLESAELIKVVSNAFLALKISFSNSIAILSDQTNADIVEVMDAVGADARIGRAFLNAGRGYGGGCFPKDVSGLIASGAQYGVDLNIMKSAQAVNDFMPDYVVNKIQKVMGGSLRQSTITVLGLAFKSGTSDVRKSPGIKIANTLQQMGATIKVYDPQANEEASGDLHVNIEVCDNLEIAIFNTDAVIIATDWGEFLDLPPKQYESLMAGSLFVDAMNVFNKLSIENAGLRYLGVGRGDKVAELSIQGGFWSNWREPTGGRLMEMIKKRTVLARKMAFSNET